MPTWFRHVLMYKYQKVTFVTHRGREVFKTVQSPGLIKVASKYIQKSEHGETIKFSLVSNLCVSEPAWPVLFLNSASICFNTNRSFFRTKSMKSCQRQPHLSPLLLRGWWTHLRTLPTPAGRVQPHFWTLHARAASPPAAPGQREGAVAGPDWRAPACRICRSRRGLWGTPTVPWSRTGRRPAAVIHLVPIVEVGSQKENHALMTSSDLAPTPPPLTG